MTPQPPPTLNVYLKAPSAWLEIDNAKKRNAMTHSMWEMFPQLLQQIADKKDIRVLVLRGAGSTFCAGADIRELIEQAGDAAFVERNQAAIRQALHALESFPLPTLAAIEGACFGGGISLALACDFRMASADSRFAVTPARLGMPYSLADTRKLHAAVGGQVCRQMLLAGRELNAEEAHSVGLILQPLPPDSLKETVNTWVERLSRLSPFAQMAIKRTLNVIEEASDESPKSLHLRMLESFSGNDFKEGVQAFIDKRKAQFQRL